MKLATSNIKPLQRHFLAKSLLEPLLCDSDTFLLPEEVLCLI